LRIPGVALSALATAWPVGALACESTDAVEVPAPERLEAAGARIRVVEIDVEEIFDTSKPGESSAPYRLANGLHVRTREDSIRSQLLFHESEPYSQQKIEETERLLRSRRYLFDAWVEPSCYDPEDGTVDVHVRVRDVWSLNPGIHFSRKGGANNGGIILEDQDFLGRGKFLSASYDKNVDRSSLLFAYEDPQILGSWWRGKVAYSDNSDGTYGAFKVERPFYSLDTRWSGGLGLASGDRVDSRYQMGKILDQFDEAADHFEISIGGSRGLQDGWAKRWLAGVRYDRSAFAPLPDEVLAAPLPADRTLAYPYVGIEWIEDDFTTVHNQDQLARTEDLEFGRSLRAEVGLASPVWGSDESAAVFALHGETGKRYGESRSLFLLADATGRWATQGLQDTLVQAEARYYQRQSPRALFFASARGALAEHPDLDHQLLLGGDNGLRGYPLRYQSGTESMLFTLEERFFTGWFPLHLFHVGAAAFADAGRTWGADVTGELPYGWLGDVGVGLRLGNARSGLGNVLHVDIAVPVVRPPGIDPYQLIIETRRSF
jgi:hypothetical protein